MTDHEDRIIDAILAAVGPAPPGTLGIGDDAAVADGLCLTTDTMVEGTHWDHRSTPEDVGWKLVAVNVSDLAGMGARPAWALLALTLPAPLDLAWVERFAAGLASACRRWPLPLLGGDTTRGPGRVATLTVGGRSGRPLLRSGARAGDRLWVTGTLGRSAEAFLASQPRPEAEAWFRRPEPPLAFAVALAEAGLATAGMDLSDGLLRDLGRLCRASGVGAVVDPAALPGDRPLDQLVAFGEDYELMFTAAPAHESAIESLSKMHGVAVTEVGSIQDAGPIRRSDGGDWPASRFAHFGNPS